MRSMFQAPMDHEIIACLVLYGWNSQKILHIFTGSHVLLARFKQVLQHPFVEHAPSNTIPPSQDDFYSRGNTGNQIHVQLPRSLISSHSRQNYICKLIF